MADYTFVRLASIDGCVAENKIEKRLNEVVEEELLHVNVSRLM